MTNPDPWQELRTVTPERQAIALAILDDVLGGYEVTRAIRRHPQ